MYEFFKNQVINLTFILALLLLAIVGYFTYQQMQRALISSNWVIHTYKVLEEVKQVETNFIKIANEINKYLVYNDAQILKTLPDTQRAIEQNIKNLRFLTQDNPDQLHRLDTLDIYKNEKIDLINKVLKASSTNGKRVFEYVSQNSRSEGSYKIAQLLNSITMEEVILLNKRTNDFNTSIQETNLLFLTLGCLGVISIVVSFVWLNYNLKKRTEQARHLEAASRLKSDFLANMSHELRTPLNSIIGFSEIMIDDSAEPVSKRHKEYLGDILFCARHLLQLVNDILDLSKIEAGKIELHPETIQLKKLINEVSTALQAMIDLKKIKYSINIEPSLTEVVLDPDKFKQILYNLISNALKFTPEGGQVEVNVYSINSNYFRLEVKDTGIGIHKDDIKKLFVEFQQLDSSTAKRYEGTGLGLALIKRIVRLQDGEVGCTSTLGKGSTFYVILPKRCLKPLKA